MPRGLQKFHLQPVGRSFGFRSEGCQDDSLVLLAWIYSRSLTPGTSPRRFSLRLHAKSLSAARTLRRGLSQPFLSLGSCPMRPTNQNVIFGIGLEHAIAPFLLLSHYDSSTSMISVIQSLEMKSTNSVVPLKISCATRKACVSLRWLLPNLPKSARFAPIDT
jgi:hypothetical protein